jgi:hypothetical protein
MKYKTKKSIVKFAPKERKKLTHIKTTILKKNPKVRKEF